MSTRGFLLSILAILSISALAQIGPEHLAQARMEKGKWAKAHYSIKKAIRKDSINPEAKLVYARWYFNQTNPDFHIDSAYKYTLASLTDYALEDQRQRERMFRFPLDSMILIHLRERIDSAAFERSKQINTEASYVSFLMKFIYAKQQVNAIELRDEVSFLDALKENTYESFDHYLAKYPDSHRAKEAKSRYEKLLFEEKTSDEKLKSYISFYKTYPQSPYRSKVEQQIFELSTVSGKLEDYLNFISQFGDTNYARKRARDIAYHIARQLDINIPKQLLSDSIRKLMRAENGYWVPFLKNGKFGFMDENGKEILVSAFKEIKEEYLCGNIIDDFVITSDGVVSRTGKLIFKGEINNVDDLGFGILLIGIKGCNQIVHKSGFKLFDDCVEDARVMTNHFLAVQKNRKWELFSFAGRRITEETYDDIQSEDEIIVLTRKGKKILATIEQVTIAADNNALPNNMVFDEVRKLSEDKVLVKNGSLEGVVNSNLKFEIQLDRQILTMTSFGFTKRVLNKISTVGLSKELDKEEFSDIRPYLNWLGLYGPANMELYHLPSSKMIEQNLDSLWFTNRLAMALKGDSVKVLFGSGKKMVFLATTKVAFVKSPDSVKYFYVEEKNKKQLFEVDTGIKRFALEFDNLEEVGNGLFLIEIKGKKGLVGLDGKLVLPIEYDAIVRSSKDVVSLLKDRKFGTYNLKNRSLVKAIYERNLIFFNESILIAFKEGFYGFIDKTASPISNFEFDEVRPWSDSSAFVKKNYRWAIYRIYDKKFTNDLIKDYKLIKDTATEKIAIVHKDNDYGVLSSTRGAVIPPTFSDVLNLGTPEKPLYFTEKSVEEAGIFVVIYYNENGEQIRREIYEADEYDRIYCR